MIVSWPVCNTRRGLTADSQEGEQVFVLNGIQTQSGHCYNLINQLPEMEGLVDIVRLSPEKRHCPGSINSRPSYRIQFIIRYPPESVTGTGNKWLACSFANGD